MSIPREFSPIPAREWLHGYRTAPLPDGRVVEVLRLHPGRWAAWIGNTSAANGETTSAFLTSAMYGVPFREAMRVAREEYARLK